MMRAAFATTDGKFVSQHFGHCQAFSIVDIDEKTLTWQFVELREVAPACNQGEHSEDSLQTSADTVADCNVLFVVKVGVQAKRLLEQRGIQVLERAGFVDELLDFYVKYLQRQPRFRMVSSPEKTIQPKPRKADSNAIRFRDFTTEHPCFSQGGLSKKGRMHLPVSGSCNIRCRFCNRAYNQHEQRPGVSSGLLPVTDVVPAVKKALELCPEISVIGIAGPGDTLASPNALEAFQKVHEAYPDLIKCLSTNGLALPGKSAELYRAGVRSLTVTVNAVDPVITGEVVSYIVFDNKVYRGAEAGEILIRQQLYGIREAVAAGILVKVNTVLIPTVNDHHIGAIAKAVSEAGASMHNIIPLIPQHEFSHIAPPTCDEIESARAIAGEYVSQFRHCQHCRADACGVPGISDFSDGLYSGRVMDTFSHG